MSASKGPKDAFLYAPFTLTPFEEAQIKMQFDMNCDLDEHDIREIKRETSFLKRVCIFKIIMFLPEYLLTFIFFGKEEAKGKKKITGLYWRFLRNKVTLERFSKELINLAQQGKVL
jgi:hypothetical protein